MIRFVRPASFAALCLLLAACSGDEDVAGNVDQLDAELAEAVEGNTADPVIAAALEQPIMVDPDLTSAANRDAVRPPAQPYAAPVPAAGVAPARGDGAPVRAVPEASGDCATCRARSDSLTLAALAARQKAGLPAACAPRMRYAAGWANRLPVDVPLHPDARLVEAAGAAEGGCTLRAVSFTLAQPLKATLDWYFTRLSDAGFSAEHQSDGTWHVLGGTRRGDGTAYLVFARARADGGTDVDLLADNGR